MSLHEIPRTWTAVAAAGTAELPRSWVRHLPPQELIYLPDNVSPPAKLLEILHWSLERSVSEAPTDEVGIDPHAPAHRSKNTETNPTAVADGSTFTTNTPSAQVRVASSKTDLVSTTLAKIAALKVTKPAKGTTTEAARSVVVATEECTSCFDDIATQKLIRLTCTHYYCKPCLASLVLTSIQNESKYDRRPVVTTANKSGSYPPKCCLTDIPTATVIVSICWPHNTLVHICHDLQTLDGSHWLTNIDSFGSTAERTVQNQSRRVLDSSR